MLVVGKYPSARRSKSQRHNAAIFFDRTIMQRNTNIKLNHHVTSNSPRDNSTSKIAQNLMFFTGTSPPGVERESRRLGSVQTARTSTSSNSAQIRVFYPNLSLPISGITLVQHPTAAFLLTSTLIPALRGSIVCTYVEPEVRKLRIQGTIAAANT